MLNTVRLRQRKLRGRQNHLEAESYNSAVGKLGLPAHSLTQGRAQELSFFRGGL